jgi:hypothetical protein
MADILFLILDESFINRRRLKVRDFGSVLMECWPLQFYNIDKSLCYYSGKNIQI